MTRILSGLLLAACFAAMGLSAGCGPRVPGASILDFGDGTIGGRAPSTELGQRAVDFTASLPDHQKFILNAAISSVVEGQCAKAGQVCTAAKVGVELRSALAGEEFLVPDAVIDGIAAEVVSRAGGQ